VLASIKLHIDYVRNTPKKAIVQMVKVLLCHLPIAVSKGVPMPCNKVYINTRVLKHVYDKRPAEEYDFLIKHIENVTRYPDKVYKNKDGKRGSFCFVKDLKNNKIFVSLEPIINNIRNEKMTSYCEVATFFRLNDDSYLTNYKLLWEWKGDNPSS